VELDHRSECELQSGMYLRVKSGRLRRPFRGQHRVMREFKSWERGWIIGVVQNMSYKVVYIYELKVVLAVLCLGGIFSAVRLVGLKRVSCSLGCVSEKGVMVRKWVLAVLLPFRKGSTVPENFSKSVQK
jgi:hypothetical protein